MIKNFCNGLLVLLFFLQADAQQPDIDSLKRLLPLAKNDTEKLILYTNLTDAYTEVKPDSAYYFASSLAKLSHQLGLKLNEAYGLDQMSYALLNLGDYPGSLQTFLLAYAIAEDPRSEENILPEKYIILKSSNKLSTTAHTLRIDIIARIIHYIGILYETTSKSHKDYYYYLKSKQLTEELGNLSELCTVYSTLGRAYMAFNNLDSAMICEQKAYDLSMESGNKKYLGSILINIGRIYKKKKNESQEIEYFRKAYNASKENCYLRGIVVCDIFFSELARQNGKIDSGIYFANAALSMANYQNIPSLKLRADSALGVIYRSIHKNDSLVKYQDAIIKIKDSIFNTQQTEEFQVVDFDYQQQKQKIENDKEAYQNRLRIYSLLSVLVILLSMAIVLWRISRQRRKTNALLVEQKKKIEKTLAELKETQNQLIQSEKMASLGELTAGIAHEIQNPLNFVNNFSELNTELIGEMKAELRSGSQANAISIADNIEENEQKINHHGKRADAIVKGMLQHSRSSVGQKEPVNINAMVDECLKLSYHSIRSKEKNFLANLQTDFDETIGKIPIIQQDIVRALVNLFNNAFYSVNEKSKQKIKDYAPAISVSTKKVMDKIEIAVKDNGSGIPQKTVDKIFQPFFTTKPTGQGTGLGLSLCYDIIKAHGGEIKVETHEGEGVCFLIIIPAS